MTMNRVLDLDAHRPPDAPPIRSRLITVRLPAHVRSWVDVRAEVLGVPPGTVVRRLVEDAAGGEGWPADVEDWLLCQAAQCDMPGDPDGAMIEVVRHLARRWPAGARLH